MRVLTRNGRRKALTDKVTGSVEATLPSGYSRHHEGRAETAGAGSRTLGNFVRFTGNFVRFTGNFVRFLGNFVRNAGNFVILTICIYLLFRYLQRFIFYSKYSNTSKSIETFEVLSLITIKALAF